MTRCWSVCFALLCALCVTVMVKGQEDTDLRTEPSYNPFFVQVGAPFSITCIKEAAARIPVIWIVNGGDPESSGFASQDGTETLDSGMVRSFSRLTKDPVGLGDITPGGLLCQTDVGEDEKEEMLISVNFFNVLMESPNITEGEDVKLKCVPDINAKVIWSRNGHVIDSRMQRRLLQDENRTLVLQDSRPQDAGVYQCKVMVETGFDFQTKETKEQTFIQNISVACKPYLTEKTASSIETQLNGSFTLQCPVRANPAPEVYWLREGVPLQPSPRFSYGTYHDVTGAIVKISGVKKEDLGMYHCVAENSIGEMTKEFHVELVGGATSEHAGLTSVLIGLCCIVSFLARG